MQKNFCKDELKAALSFIHENLEALKLSHKNAMRAELFCEEALLRLMAYAYFNTTNYFRVRVRKSFGNILIDLAVPGDEFDFAESLELPEYEEISYGDSQEAIIQNLLLRSFIGQASFRHSRNFNIVTLAALRSNYSGLYKVLSALFLAVAAGLLMRAFLPEDLCMKINDNIFALKDMIINLMPDNLIRPFLEDNMLQLIMLAVLMGSAAGIAGAQSIIKGCNELNAIFMRVTALLIKVGGCIYTAVTTIEDMFRTPTNCIGNITPTLLAAKSANLIDLEEYNRL